MAGQKVPEIKYEDPIVALARQFVNFENGHLAGKPSWVDTPQDGYYTVTSKECFSLTDDQRIIRLRMDHGRSIYDFGAGDYNTTEYARSTETFLDVLYDRTVNEMNYICGDWCIKRNPNGTSDVRSQTHIAVERGTEGIPIPKHEGLYLKGVEDVYLGECSMSDLPFVGVKIYIQVSNSTITCEPCD